MNEEKKYDLNLVMALLIAAGAGINYVYAGSIGDGRGVGLYQKLGIFGVVMISYLLECLILKSNRCHSLTWGAILKRAFSTSTVTGLFLLVMMTSLSIPLVFYFISALLFLLLHRLKAPVIFSAPGIYFIIIAVSVARQPDANYLFAPYLHSLGGDWEDFRRMFFSLPIVGAGIVSGPLAFNLFLPGLAGALFLAHRKCVQLFWPLAFVLAYVAFSIFYFGMAQWRLPLFLLNGSILVTGTFLVPLGLDRLPPGINKLVYALLLGICSFIASYYLNFIWGAYLAFLLLHLLLWAGNAIEEKNRIGRQAE